MNGKRSFSLSLAALCAGAVALAGCDKQADSQAAPSAAATAPAPPSSAAPQAQAAAYTPPSADQLYQMVAPIALFPDKLVAQVLAGATYPDQIGAADAWLAQNKGLKATDLQNALEQQTWDPSVKSLTAFPGVLDQMGQNIAWTAALGQAYANDPTDVLNAIQVMRQRASQHGNLRSTAQQQVVTRSVSEAAPPPPPPEQETVTTTTTTYQGPAIVPAPSQIIEVEPADPDTVYVPSYDPAVVYGDPVPLYPSYAYRPYYAGPNPIVVGAVSFGVGVLVGALLDHHHGGGGWGWHSWGMNWGGGYGGGGWSRPAVVYNHNTYVTRPTTVINRISNHYTVNNFNGNRFVNNDNRFVHNGAVENNRFEANRPGGFGAPAQRFAANAGERPEAVAHGPMSMPNFSHALERNQVAQGPHPGQAEPIANRGASPSFARGVEAGAPPRFNGAMRPMQPRQPMQPQAFHAPAAADAHGAMAAPGVRQPPPHAPAAAAPAPQAFRNEAAAPRQDVHREEAPPRPQAFHAEAQPHPSFHGENHAQFNAPRPQPQHAPWAQPEHQAAHREGGEHAHEHRP